MRDNSFFANFFFEKSDESDFSDFELHRKINGFAGFTEQKLLKLKADLKLKMPLKELAALRRRFGGKNTPTVMALKILDDYRSSARALFTEEINEIRLTNKNPHIMKALKKYEELKKRFSPYTPRNISELGMMNLNAAANEKDSVFIGAGRAQTECETFDKGRRVGYYTMLVTKWDDGEGSRFAFKNSNLSLNVGAGLKLLRHLQVGATYNIPLGKTAEVEGVAEAADMAFSAKLKTWQVSVAYMF